MCFFLSIDSDALMQKNAVHIYLLNSEHGDSYLETYYISTRLINDYNK